MGVAFVTTLTNGNLNLWRVHLCLCLLSASLGLYNNVLVFRDMMLKYFDLQRYTAQHREQLQAAVSRVVNSGWYLLGNEVKAFENAYAQYIGTAHCVACGNGLDALSLIFKAYMERGLLHPGDEVLVPANTYIASIISITSSGLMPVLVEPHLDTFQIDAQQMVKHVGPRTKALLIVHLYGKCAFTNELLSLCSEHELLVIEDNAQAHGCLWNDKRTGSIGHAAAHSFYPGKNLGALGDAGGVTTNDEVLAGIIRAIANYGSNKKYVFQYVGQNSRMDEVQAAVLSEKLKWLDQDNQRRTAIAQHYVEGISNENITLPTRDYLVNNVFHIFPVLCAQREKLQQELHQRGIETIIHYPIPPHKQQCYSHWAQLSMPITERIHNEELSLPLNPTMTDDEVQLVISQVSDIKL